MEYGSPGLMFVKRYTYYKIKPVAQEIMVILSFIQIRYTLTKLIVDIILQFLRVGGETLYDCLLIALSVTTTIR